ncbi:MAG: MFS transporter [Phycisphaerae bacterium]
MSNAPTSNSDLANEKPAANAPPPAGKIRWIVCFLLFFATTTNYVDRAILSVLFPILSNSPSGVQLVDPQPGAVVPTPATLPAGAIAPTTAPAVSIPEGQEWWAKLPDGAAVVDDHGDTKIVKHVLPGLGWTNTDYGYINTIFSGAYALGLLLAGGFIRKIGIKWGFFWAVIAWTIASRAHGLVALINPHSTMNIFGQTVLTTVVAFCICRIFLGLFEAANFPAAIAATAEWFPKKERALSTGIFNCGSNVGAMIAPFIVPAIAVSLGWSVSFYITGILAVIWLILWAIYYQSPQNHKSLTPEELAYIESDKDERQPTVKLPWSRFFFRRQTIAFSIGKFLTDGIWWFYLFWVPGFLKDTFHVKITDLTLPMIVIYTSTTFGSIGGGWMSSALIKKGWTVNAARKITMLVFALCVVPAFAVALVPNMWAAILLIALAASAHQAFSANIFTLVSDTVPKQGVSAVTGIGAMAGGIGSMIFQTAVGIIVDKTGTFVIPFIIASTAYVIAVLFIHLILPRLERMELDDVPTTTGPTPLDP